MHFGIERVASIFENQGEYENSDREKYAHFCDPRWIEIAGEQNKNHTVGQSLSIKAVSKRFDVTHKSQSSSLIRASPKMPKK